MKIALVIGVSEYERLSSLPACDSDAKLIQAILEATGKYDSVLSLYGNKPAAQVKQEAADWIDGFRSKEIDEILFYYTGHGDFNNGEFYYPLSDFNKDNRQQTSLANSEVDNWLRSLEPNLAVKVVDACHAGIPYVKDEDQTLAKYLKESGKTFGSCYFMFSSTLDQSSYQDEELSFFTRSFTRAVENHQTERIRFKDIIDFISDEFEHNSWQTPFFVAQANYTEVFCEITPELITLFSESAKTNMGDEALETSLPEENPQTLKQIVQQDAQKYCSEEEVNDLFKSLNDKVEKLPFPVDFVALYQVNTTFDEYQESIPRAEVIGKWLNNNTHNYFAEPKLIKETYKDEVPVYPMAVYMGGPYKSVTKSRWVVDSFKITAELPYEVINIIAESKYPNISWNKCQIVPLVSKTHIRFFYFFAIFREKNWQDREIDEDIKWQTEEYPLKDQEAVYNAVHDLIMQFAKWVMQQVDAQFSQ